MAEAICRAGCGVDSHAGTPYWGQRHHGERRIEHRRDARAALAVVREHDARRGEGLLERAVALMEHHLGGGSSNHVEMYAWLADARRREGGAT